MGISATQTGPIQTGKVELADTAAAGANGGGDAGATATAASNVDVASIKQALEGFQGFVSQVTSFLKGGGAPADAKAGATATAGGPSGASSTNGPAQGGGEQRGEDHVDGQGRVHRDHGKHKGHHKHGKHGKGGDAVGVAGGGATTVTQGGATPAKVSQSSGSITIPDTGADATKADATGKAAKDTKDAKGASPKQA
jgi:hypothetical protein